MLQDSFFVKTVVRARGPCQMIIHSSLFFFFSQSLKPASSDFLIKSQMDQGLKSMKQVQKFVTIVYCHHLSHMSNR